MIVLDASILTAFLDGSDDHHDAAEALLAAGIDEARGVPLLRH